MAFYYTSHDLKEIQTWYSKNLNMTVERGVDWIGWVITLTAANGTVEFRPFQPRNITYNPASFIPHLLEEFDGHGLSYTFNFNSSAEVDRYDLSETYSYGLCSAAVAEKCPSVDRLTPPKHFTVQHHLESSLAVL